MAKRQSTLVSDSQRNFEYAANRAMGLANRADYLRIEGFPRATTEENAGNYAEVARAYFDAVQFAYRLAMAELKQGFTAPVSGNK